MERKEVEFLQGLLEIFKVEAQEHISSMSNGIVELEKAATPEQQAALIESIYREAHSLKGAARAVNKDEIEGLCQKLESVFAEMKKGHLKGTLALFDILHRAASDLETVIQAQHGPRSVAEAARTQQICQDLEAVIQGKHTQADPAKAATPERPKRSKPTESLKPILDSGPVETPHEAPQPAPRPPRW